MGVGFEYDTRTRGARWVPVRDVQGEGEGCVDVCEGGCGEEGDEPGGFRRWLEGGEADADEDEEGEGTAREGGGKPGRGQKRAGPPGLWGNMLTFLNGNPLNGNRACIGFRFAVNE